MMTLSKQLMCVICTLLTLVFIGIFIITLENSRRYFSEQLNSNAQDTATSLGLSLSAKIQQKDKASMLAMVDAIFDRGYFLSVSVTSIEGDVMIDRYHDSDLSAVPTWFSQLISFPTAKAEALLMSGWQQAGKVSVISDPGYAYRDLWNISLRLFYWYIFLLIAISVCSYIALRWLLNPLKTVALQAKAICEKEFPIQSSLPRTLELRQLSEAMNKMVIKLKAIFAEHAKKTEKLRSEAYQDPLTGQGNRVLFNQQLTHTLRSEDDYRSGHLILIELQGLAEFNRTHGYQQGDQLIMSIVNALNRVYLEHDTVNQCRIAGACFACLLLETEPSNVDAFNRQTIALLSAIIKKADPLLAIHLGAVKYDFGMRVGELLSLADQALTMARSQGECNAYHYVYDKEEAFLTASEWRDEIAAALDNRRLSYNSQVVMGDDGSIYHQEVLLKLLDSQSKVIPAPQFIPVCEKYAMADKLDLLVTEYIVDHILSHTPQRPLAVNLSRQSVTAPTFIEQLTPIVKRLPSAKRHLLQFELSEATALRDIRMTSQFITALKTLSLCVGLDRVGANFTPLDYLDYLAIEYLKIDGSFTVDLAEKENNNYFIRQLKDAAAMMEVDIIASHIETEQSWTTYKDLGIKWGQGYYFGQAVEILFNKT